MPRTQIYSRRFLSQYVSSTPTAATARYTVPAGKVAVVRSVDLFVYVVGRVDVSRTFAPDALGIVSSDGIAVGRGLHWDGDYVLDAGESFGAVWTSGGIGVHASGFLFNVAP